MFEGIQYMVIEGVIGVGKTSLVEMLSENHATGKMIEQSDQNPFLEDFYRNKDKYSFQTQIWFLLSRFRQISDGLTQRDLFHGTVISDFMFAKDQIFAHLNLDDNELALYKKICEALTGNLPKPDYVVYLQASTPVLMERIAERGRPFERNMEKGYIEALNQAYNQFFFHYEDSPLLIVNTDDIDFVKNPDEFDEVVLEIQKYRSGSRIYHPLSKKHLHKL